MDMSSAEPVELAVAANSFGALLRQYRLAIGLTQESLAQRAGLSVHGIHKLEVGVTHPYRDTAQRLIAALQLGAADEARLRSAARPAPRRDRQRALTRAAPTTSPRNNLPIPLTSFVPRKGELARVSERLRVSRLLTITGSGGCGKTRLALEVARQVNDAFTDGVWLIDLAPLRSGALVPQTIAAIMGMRDARGRSVLDALIHYLHNRHMLLILDNCEHLISACAHVADTLLRSCSDLHVLATSRELLGAAGEATWRVKSLSVIAPDSVATASAESIEELVASEAAQLFVDRARLVMPSFAVNGHNAFAVAQVCQRLDGNPLAIELATARLDTLTVHQIAARLDQRFRLLSRGSRTAVRRQKTLQATVDWSYQLLSKEEQVLVRRLAVFAGGWSLEAAEALGADLVKPQTDVFELLGGLVDKSMVLAEEPGDNEPHVFRYRFLETIREYAEEKLVDAGEADGARTRHRDWYLVLAERAMEGMEGAEQKSWWDRLELEHDNLRVAVRWSAADPSRSAAVLGFAGLLRRFWQTRGYVHEWLGWLESAVAGSAATPSVPGVRALSSLGQNETDDGNIERGQMLLAESVRQARTLGDRRVLSLALRHFGMGLMVVGDYAQARGPIEEALAVSRAAGIKREIAFNLWALVESRYDMGDSEDLEPLLIESVVAGRESGDLVPVISATRSLGRLYWQRGDTARARGKLDEALALARQIDMKFAMPALLVTLGDLARVEGDLDAAEDWYRQGLRAARRMATAVSMAHALRHYAAILGARRDHRGVVRVLGATASVQKSSGALLGDLPARGRRPVGHRTASPPRN